MPSRVIDYTALWTSQKLEQCPIWARREYPWLYGLADVNGSFEITNVRALWMQVAPIRPDLTLDLLRKIFREYHRRGVLFTWQVRRKWFGHWTSSDKPGRLPRFSQRKRFRWYAPAVPKKALRLYANRFAHKHISGDVDTLPRRGRVPSVGGGSKGIGDSNSKGKGKGKGKGKRGAARKARAASSPTPATQASGVVKGLQFHHIGKKLNVTKSTHILLDETFGHALNLEQVYKEADLWLVRTGKGRPSVLKFLGNWCKKELTGNVMATKEASMGRYAGTVSARQPQPEPITKPIASDDVLRTGNALWDTLLNQLALKMNKHTYQTWFAPTRVWDWNEKETILVVQAPSKMILHWLVQEGRLHLEKFLRGMVVIFVGPDGKTQEAK